MHGQGMVDSLWNSSKCVSPLLFVYRRYIGALGARVICDNIPGLVNKQRQLCQRHPDIMQAIGEGTKEWIRECQHQFRHHRWNCSTLDRDHTVFGRVLLRSKSACVWKVNVMPEGMEGEAKLWLWLWESSFSPFSFSFSSFSFTSLCSLLLFLLYVC